MPPVLPAHIERLLVVLPSWVGDVVMAAPTLRALRALYPEARITCLAKKAVRPVIDAAPWYDRLITDRSSAGGRRRGLLSLATRLRSERFDMAVLLPNSFRTALLARLAGIPRRIGYARDGRGWLLTDRLVPLREDGRFKPVSAVDYYLEIVRDLGADDPDPTLELHTHQRDDAAADAMLRSGGIDRSKPLVLLNPGASYGDAKMWYPDRFAAVADRLADSHDARILLNGSPKERAILDAVKGAARTPMLDLPQAGGSLRLLKSVVKRCSLMITNDTGPRHFAVAFGVPVVTIFGPTDPRWSESDFALEHKVMVDVFCGPCQKKQCPLDHRCMTRIGPDMVYDRAAELLASGAREPQRH